MDYQNLVGTKYPNCEIISVIGLMNNGTPIVQCRCRCGKVYQTTANRLKQRKDRSCGCRTNWKNTKPANQKKIIDYEKKPCQPSASLCWDCKHAVPNNIDTGCSWSTKFKPVKGWTATPTVKKNKGMGDTHSYHVTACPKFERG